MDILQNGLEEGPARFAQSGEDHNSKPELILPPTGLIAKVFAWFAGKPDRKKVARFYANEWGKAHPGSGFDPSEYSDEQILEAFNNGAFSKTADDRFDPLQLLGIITVFRSGPTLIARPGVDIRIDKNTGLVQPGRGVSVEMDPAGLDRFGGPYKVESVPDELEIIQRGARPSHHEIAPRQPMTPERYLELLNQVKLTTPVPK